MLTRLAKDAGAQHQQIARLLLVLLLLLRIPYTIAIIYLLPIENQNGAAWYEVGTYLLICFLIWWERQRLDEFHLDLPALVLIWIRPVQTLILSYWNVDSPLAFPRPLGFALWVIALGSCLALWSSGFRSARFTSRSAAWLLGGVLVGIGLSVAKDAPSVWSMLQDSGGGQPGLTPVLFSTSLNLLYHLGFAPVNEEPLFRGFLWGTLRQWKWNETQIWLVQAALFTSAHIYIARQFPSMFWIFIPFAGLILGLLAWRSRSIAPALLAHTMVNGSVYLLITISILRVVK